jgi:excisionase family DNA binding protein
MPVITLGQASKVVGISKPTISKAISSGKITAKKVDGIFQIEVSELLRVYPAVTGTKAEPVKPVGTTATDDIELRFMKEKVADLERRLGQMQVERDQAQRDNRENLARTMSLLESTRSKGLWSRLTGK